jgi:hypothetical protein
MCPPNRPSWVQDLPSISMIIRSCRWTRSLRSRGYLVHWRTWFGESPGIIFSWLFAHADELAVWEAVAIWYTGEHDLARARVSYFHDETSSIHNNPEAIHCSLVAHLHCCSHAIHSWLRPASNYLFIYLGSAMSWRRVVATSASQAREDWPVEGWTEAQFGGGMVSGSYQVLGSRTLFLLVSTGLIFSFTCQSFILLPLRIIWAIFYRTFSSLRKKALWSQRGEFWSQKITE